MSRMARIPGVERGVPEDTEAGAYVYSLTHKHLTDLPVGGVVYEVIDVDPSTGEVIDDPTVRIIRWNHRPLSPYLFDLKLSDVDHELTTFFTRACDIEAQTFDRFFAGLKTKRDRDDAAHWRRIGAGLAAMASTGHYTPRAAQREKASHEQRRETFVEVEAPVDFDARVAELTPKLEAAILAARARRENNG